MQDPVFIQPAGIRKQAAQQHRCLHPDLCRDHKAKTGLLADLTGCITASLGDPVVPVQGFHNPELSVDIMVPLQRSERHNHAHGLPKYCSM